MDAAGTHPAPRPLAAVTWIRPELAWTTAPAPAGERYAIADPSRLARRLPDAVAAPRA